MQRFEFRSECIVFGQISLDSGCGLEWVHLYHRSGFKMQLYGKLDLIDLSNQIRDGSVMSDFLYPCHMASALRVLSVFISV